MDLNNKSILVTGGTGSFGQKFVEVVLKRYRPKKLIVFSRDEYKQFLMKKKFDSSKLRYFIGDVRDPERLHRAFDGVDIVLHAAALKQIPPLEYNPFEAIKTNVLGAENVINAALNNKVKRVLALSSDKAVNPINLYGASKLCADKLFVAANSYSGDIKPRFSVVRYGNVLNSRGSVVQLFKEQRSKGILTITDGRMTRFWITLDEGVNFVLKCLEIMDGGEIFVPKTSSMKILDLANAIAPKCKHRVIGIRPGEKLHEVLIPEDESHNTLESKDMYLIMTPFHFWGKKKNFKDFKKVKNGFRYSSDTNKKWLTVEDLKRILTE